MAYSLNKTSVSDINILLLGETGVGKSTFINAFANYLNFPTFGDAEKSHEPICLINTSFVISDATKQKVTVCFGEKDDNESSNVLDGESGTLSSKDYLFTFGNYVIRFIDTPGIGDTKGIERDKKNLENILQAIGAHEKLNAICILLKPNISKLTPSFEFVVSQLLSQLDKSAVNNLIFVYTHARGSNFTPGGTDIPINKLLSTIATDMKVVIPHEIDKNVFCMDNETFQFMLAVRQNVNFGKRGKRNYEDSWDESVSECERLMKYVVGVPGKGGGLKPHNTKETKGISETRRMIEKLQKPLEDIAKNIQLNISTLKENGEEIRKFDGDIKELADKYSIPFYETVTSELPEPHLACKSRRCSQYITLKGGATYTHYPEICQTFGVKSGLAITIRQLTEPVMKYFCPIFNWNGTCKNCGCIWNEHSVENYTTSIVEKKDESLKFQLDEKKSEKEIKKAMMDRIQRRVDDINGEQNVIMDSMAKFAHFLKENAIIAYNDSFKKYIDNQIENEETKKPDQMRDDQIQRYKQMLKDYGRMKDNFTAALKCGQKGLITKDSVFNLIDNLYELPINGDMIRKLCSMEQRTDRNYMERAQVIHRVKNYDSGNVVSGLATLFKGLFSK